MKTCFTSPPTQYGLYGRQFLQVKRLDQQYQSTEGTYMYSTDITQKYNKQTSKHKMQQNVLVYTDME